MADYDWTYDFLGRVTSFYSLNDNDTAAYAYDWTGQLTGVTHTNTSFTAEDYGYDLTGNRTDGDYETEAGSNNQLQSDGTFTYQYDGEGNLTVRTRISSDPADDFTTEYKWDHRNRLTEVVFKNNSGVVTKRVAYTYDVYDRRIAKQVDDNGNGVFDRSEQFIYDVNRDMLLALADPDGDAGPASSSLTNRYLNGALVDQVLADEVIDGTPGEMGDVYWPLTDNLGSVRDIVRRDAVFGTQAIEHLRYDSFGEIEFDDNPGFTHRFSYTGREFDADIGLYYYRARWYDPVTHRFISEDPIGFAAGHPNFGSYVGNSPVNGTDPFGLETWSFNEITGPIRGAIGNVTKWWHKPIMRPVPRDWPTTSLPINPAYAQKRFEAGDPNYTTTMGEFIDDYHMMVVDITLVYTGLLRIPGSSSRYAIPPRGTSCPVVVAPKPPFDHVPPVQPPFNPVGTLGAAKTWTMKARLKHAQLPTSGKIRYIPPKGHPATQPLPRGPNSGYLDRFGNEWTKGPSRTAGQPFEWDVQVGRNATPGFCKLSGDGKHVNVSLDGKVTH